MHSSCRMCVPYFPFGETAATDINIALSNTKNKEKALEACVLAVIFSGCPNQEIGCPFLLKGLKIKKTFFIFGCGCRHLKRVVQGQGKGHKQRDPTKQGFN
jgi:hypothetical protein